MADVVPIAIFLLLYVFTFLIWSWLLVLGAEWAKLPSVGLSQAMFVAMFVKTTVVAIQVYAFLNWREETSVLIDVMLLFLPSLIELMAIRWMLNGTKLQTLKTWLPTWLAIIPGLVFAFAVLRPFVIATFSIPTNAMAPTLLGEHILSTCPQCGANAYSTPMWMDSGQRPAELPFICDNLHLTDQPVTRSTSFGLGDRILVNKMIKPRRWDIIVFDAPTHANRKYVKRLVGMPGETVQIADGAIWINGAKLSPPASLEGITYADAIMDQPIPNGLNPVQLGADEHFVLGDFTTMSHDSRMWITRIQADGRPPYAVPASDIIGVATHLYLNRWKSILPDRSQ